MDFIGTGRRLDAADFRRVAEFLGCEVAAVRAVVEVEAAGVGFDAANRPRILFEPHIFYRELGAGRARDRAVREGLAYPKWKRGAYPSKSDDRYDQVRRAMAIDASAALKSASWGLGQVMGFNHRLAGFSTVQDMVAAMMQGEGEQLRAMAGFIDANGLARYLNPFNARSFARGYNGSAYAKNGYHTKLDAALAKWRAIGGKARPRGSIPYEADDATLRRGASGAGVRTMQGRLARHGFIDAVEIDGKFGPATESAVKAFQADKGLEADGWIGPQTRAALLREPDLPAAVQAPIPPIEPSPTVPIPTTLAEAVGMFFAKLMEA